MRRGPLIGQSKTFVQRGMWIEEFELGVLYLHRPGPILTEADNVLFTTLTMNTCRSRNDCMAMMAHTYQSQSCHSPNRGSASAPRRRIEEPRLYRPHRGCR
ncbi:Mycobacterium rhizamassiliense ORFan [Mycobacterium rhizamassiliense]|jgi:hypothetical protein|uniref:Mycobacterium numidiamassiliense ORFan n=2 Tax=Mycobacterium TaxID=1763 RepID=A0A2U3PAJ1_9MYCO|nr:Mycobacterium rhizamassiliense ORFan [Mycobacterium rhizamassiliense]SPM40752.1 Mycobacterium numidiamassiliense ORFan [Mycobacterium numidiamassiliense]